MQLAHPILSCAQAADWEAKVLGKSPETAWKAMTRAGEAVGRQVLLDWQEIAPVPDAPRLLVLCGSGHNGGDALIAVRYQLERLPHARAHVILVFGRAKLKPLTERALRSLEQLGERVRVHEWSRGAAVHLSQRRFQICIDGVLGMQFRPPLREPAPELFDFVDALGDQVEMRVAIDLPSGIGDESAEEGFCADFTYATGIAKRPALDPALAQRVGRLRYLDIGFFDDQRPSEISEQLLLASCLRQLRGLRNPLSDKRSYGHVLLVGGSRAMPGAISMAAMAATRAGAGLVTVAVPANLSSRMAPLLPEAMWLPLPIDRDGQLVAEEALSILRSKLDRANALVMGPGMELGREVRSLLSQLVREAECPCVLDATALQDEILRVASDRSSGAAPVIITPHMGEFSRLADDAPEQYDSEFHKEFAQKHRVLTLLKGPTTHISDGAQVYASPYGGPALARGGSGDMLAGIIGALVARPKCDVLQSVCQAAVWHGLAAEALARTRGQHAVRTTELLDYLSPVVRSL